MNKEQYERVMHLCDVLESGKYTKGRGCLRSGDSFCCLGVACDISGLGQWEKNTIGQLQYTISDSDYSHMRLPIAVRDYYGFPTSLGSNIFPDYSLANLNDGTCIKEHSHPAIAEIIRKWAEEKYRQTLRNRVHNCATEELSKTDEQD